MADPTEPGLQPSESRLPQKLERAPTPSWSEIADSFEVLGKVGLAMAVGLSAAGLFCRLADQGRIRVPSLPELVLNGDRACSKGARKRASESA